MKPNKPLPKLIERVRHKPVLIVVPLLVVALALILMIRGGGASPEASSFFEVRRGDFLISVVEGGTIEAVSEVVIRSEVEGTSRIIYIVAEGSYVKKGELLVELDSSSSQDAVSQQQINVEKARFALVQAEQQLEIQESTAQSETNAAILKLELAKLDLDRFENGEATNAVQNADIEIRRNREDLSIAQDRLDLSIKLNEKGFESKMKLDTDTLAVVSLELRLDQATRAMEMLRKFDQPKKLRELSALVQESEENLQRVKLQAERRIVQSEADVDTQRRTLELSERKLERDLRQLAATKIIAPQDGLVVYATGGNRFSSESMIEEGAVIRNRQELIKLPDVSEMKLQVKIHESHINQIRRGQSAFVVLDSMPDLRFRGVVHRVAPLPDSSSRWGNPNLKVYATEILVADRLPDVKPGVSARAEIIVTNIADVLTVPIQAVTTRSGQQVVYVAGAAPRPVPVQVGLYNTRFIEVTSGLKHGDRVLLSPPFDSDEKDLAGSIVSSADSLSAVDTNRLAQVVAHADRNVRQRPAVAAGAEPAAGAPRTERPEMQVARQEGAPGEGRRRTEGADGEVRRRPEGAAGEERQRPEGGARQGREERAQAEGAAPEADSAAPRREGRQGLSREEMMKQFDTDGDGVLSETERAAMRERFGGGERRRPEAPAGGTSN